MTTLRFFVAVLIFFIGEHVMLAQPLDRTHRPDPQPLPLIDLPDIQKTTLSNGLRIWLVENHKHPLVALNLVLLTGEDHDPLDAPGTASMTAEMLDEGTTSRDALQISDELDFIGANLRVGTNTDGMFLTLNTLTTHLEKALAIYTDVVVHPSFPAKEFERLKQQRLTSLLQQKDRPGAIATSAFHRIIYGPDHPYGMNASGTEESITALTREDLVHFYETYVHPNNAVLIGVGDITLNDLAAKLESGFADWKSAHSVKKTISPPRPLKARTIYLIDKPDAAQSEIRIGYSAAPRTSPDYFALQVMNRELGGQFSSRLNLNLREKHGYTYGARSSFQFNRYAGPFVAYSAVVTAKTDSSVREFMNEIEGMHRGGMTSDELDFVKKGLTGNFVLGFETPSQVAGALQNVVLYDLPENYYETYLQNVRNVSVEDIRDVSSRYLDASTMAIVIVGDLKIIRDGVEKLGYGEVIVCDVTGKPLTQ